MGVHGDTRHKMKYTFAFLALLIGTTMSLKCYNYGPTTSALSTTLVNTLAACTTGQTTPCIIESTDTGVFCHNQYGGPGGATNKDGGVTVAGSACETGTTTDGTKQCCCQTDYCNTEVECSPAARVGVLGVLFAVIAAMQH